MSELKQDVKEFLSYFKNRKDALLKIDTGDLSLNLQFKKALFFMMFDTLSKSISKQNDGNRKRFIKLMEDFSGWDTWNKISFIHLIQYVKQNQKPELNIIRDFINVNYKNYNKMNIGLILECKKIDIDIEDIKDKVSKLIKNKIPFENLMHKNLFYNLRNSFIHELRQLGYGIEFEEDITQEEPFYTSRDTDEGNTWDIVYPLGFFIKIFDNIIKGLKFYYCNYNINPYNYYKKVPFYIDLFNTEYHYCPIKNRINSTG